MKIRAKGFLPVVALVSALLPRAAQAGDATLAEALFRDGKALLEAGDYPHACPKLRESFKQDPATGTLLALALCLEQQGLLASAWTSYSQVASRAHAEGRSDREQAARERVGALGPRLSKLVVQVPPEVAALPALLVKRDGQPLAEAAWGSELPVDAGEHTVEVSAGGRKSWRKTVTLAAERDTQTLIVPVLEPVLTTMVAPAVPAVSPAVAPPNTTTDEPKEPKEPSSLLRPVGVAVLGVGVVGVGVGAAFGLKAKSADSESKADGHCDASGCDAVGKARRNDAFSAARVSTALFIAGGVLAAVGVTLYAVGGKRSASVALTPSVGPSSAALWLDGRFW